MISNEELLPFAERYAKSMGIELVRQPLLGYGNDGTVWKSDRDTAIKVIERELTYRQELECYRRFKKSETRDICGYAVPYLEGHDDSLRVIEMTMVEPPYVLDFGKVYIEQLPPYFVDTHEKARRFAEWRKRFTDSDWQDAVFVMDALRRQFGIYYTDPRPSNICSGNVDPNEDTDNWLHDSPPDYGDLEEGELA